MADDSTLIRTEALAASYAGGVRALVDIDLAIPRGQFLSVVGPSGCGKSTLLRLVAGLIEPSAGRIEISGQRPAEARRAGTRISFVFQDATLLPWRTVAGNIGLPLELQGSPRAERKASIERGLELVGLADFAHRFPRELSGGMRMRVALARALATDPHLLLLDEPFAALDDISRGRLNEELQRLWADRGWTAIFVTHNIAEAVFLSQRVLVMTSRPGRIAAEIMAPLGQRRDDRLRGEASYAEIVGQAQAALKRAHA